MDIKLFAGNKEIITPKFEIDIDNEDKIIGICISNFNEEKQFFFQEKLKKIKSKNLILNEKYIAINYDNEVYYFEILNLNNYNILKLLRTGSYDLMFAFIDENKYIIKKEYSVFILKNYPLKYLD